MRKVRTALADAGTYATRHLFPTSPCPCISQAEVVTRRSSCDLRLAELPLPYRSGPRIASLKQRFCEPLEQR